jgi:N-acyl-D-amino-acid deacylase
MHDTVIRGGTVVDGSGKTAYTGDVAVDGGTISQVGGKAGPGKREIDADGLLVTPGWVDVHTHYDGHATRDPVLAPSSWHDVTTIPRRVRSGAERGSFGTDRHDGIY